MRKWLSVISDARLFPKYFYWKYASTMTPFHEETRSVKLSAYPLLRRLVVQGVRKCEG